VGGFCGTTQKLDEKFLQNSCQKIFNKATIWKT